MNKSLRLLAGAAVAITAMVATACSTQPAAVTDSGYPETLTLGVIPAETSTDLNASYEPITKLIEAETGAKVEISQASDYAGVIEGLIAGQVDLAFLGSFAYVIATHNNAEITPLAAAIGEKGAAPGYHSLAITRSDNNEINTLADFKGKSVCFVDPGSTSGFLYPSAGLIDAGVITSSAEKELSAGVKPVFAGGHDASALAVAAGDCEAGFAMQSMVEETLPAKGELKKGDLKVVWTSATISGSLFVGNNTLGEEKLAELSALLSEKANRDYLLANNFCSGECRVTHEEAWGLAPAKDTDYNGVREVCALTKSEKCEG